MVLHKLRVTTWVFSLLVDVNVYIEPIRRGCSVFCKNVDYSNMSTKVLSKTYIRTSYICIGINKQGWWSLTAASQL